MNYNIGLCFDFLLLIVFHCFVILLHCTSFMIFVQCHWFILLELQISITCTFNPIKHCYFNLCILSISLSSICSLALFVFLYFRNGATPSSYCINVVFLLWSYPQMDLKLIWNRLLTEIKNIHELKFVDILVQCNVYLFASTILFR